MDVTLGRRGRSVIGGVLAAAREELADRDTDDVPARLRKVAASSARSLPPPLEQALVAALVEDPIFRASVRERWTDGNDADPLEALFLDSPERAIPLVERIAEADELVETRRLLTKAQREVEELTDTVKEAKARSVKAQERARSDLVAQKATDKAARRALEDSARSSAEEVRALREAVEARDATIAQATARVAELEAAMARRTQRDQRRSRPPAPVRPTAGPPATDPVAIAVAADAWERALRPYRARRAPSGDEEALSALAVPAGVAPDTADALDALITQGIELVVIDGYNVSGALMREGFSGPRGRASVEQMATTLSRRGATSVIVWFDALGVDGRPSFATDLGVEIRFAQDRTADDAIVEEVRTTTARVVVVTNDRELRERVGSIGIVAVWSDALIAWANR